MNGSSLTIFRHDTNTITVTLPATAGCTYDLNGNLLSDGQRGFAYENENQLVRITTTNVWKSVKGVSPHF